MTIAASTAANAAYWDQYCNDYGDGGGRRWGEVEAILGRPSTAEEMEQASALMHELDDEFTERMRRAIAAHATPDERRPLITEIQTRYEREYLAITGMTAAQVDDLLVADVIRRSAEACPGSDASARTRGTATRPWCSGIETTRLSTSKHRRAALCMCLSP